MDFSEDIIWTVWGKGQVVGANDPVYWRMDTCGAWMFRSQYKIRDSEYGWEIVRIKPLERGSKNDISNLIPMHCKNITRKEDGSFNCIVTSESYRNVDAKNSPPPIFKS